nr:reverse transcriptase domain-containing protein [Tanacetum cinerariifolium]
MSAMTNTTPLMTTVTKPATNPRDADATPWVNIQELCEEYYEDILPIIMDKVRRDRRKDVHTRLDFAEGARERTREDSHHSSARARTTKPELLKVQDRLRYGDRHVLDRLGHQRQSAFDRLSETYSPSTTKSRPWRTYSRDLPRGRSRLHRLDTSNKDCPKNRERFHSVGESYDDSFSHSYPDENCSHHMKRRRDSESPLSNVSKSNSNDGRYRRSRSKRHKSMDEDDLTRPWMCEEEDPFKPRIRNFESSRRTRMPNNVKTYDGTGDPEDHVKIFLAAAQVERWAMATWCHMFLNPNRSSQETGRIKGAPECMRIFGFMHGVNNSELTKCLNEHVPKTMDEMMITTTAFIRGEVATTSKKKGHTSWKAQDQSKRQTLDKRFDFRGYSREGKGSNRFTPLTRTPKEILAAEAGKLQPPPPMMTPIEKRSTNKFCDFYNDKGHSTDECMQLKKKIEELVRASKLSHLIKEIKHRRDQSNIGKKETPAKDKPMAIYMIQSWQRTTRQKVTQSFERVKEIAFPPVAASSGTNGSFIIEEEMGGHVIHRMYVDGGSSMEILYEQCFNRLRPEIKSQMVPSTTSLTGFSGETIWPLRQLRLLVIIGDANHFTRAWMNFMIVRSLSPYNGITGRPRIREIQAVPSTAHEMLEFLVEGGIVKICSTILIPTECTSVITSSTVSKEEKIRPDNFTVALHPDFPDQEVAIEGMLSDKGRTKMCSILKKNLDIFAWQPSDMTGAPERAKAIQADVQKLVEAGIMREVYYHNWLSNQVMVKKHDGSWRKCVDFTDLNKAYLQDCYPLSEIDWTVESLCGYPFKCFLDAHKGYHQIQLAEPDKEKTAFHTGQGVCCYTKMAFDLKNAGTTYQRLMNKAFKSQIGRNIEVCVYDLVVNSYTEAEMLRDIEETFHTHPDGIKPCPDKTAAVLQLPSPRTIKEPRDFDGISKRILSQSLPINPSSKSCLILRGRMAAKMEYHASRAQYCVQAKNVSQRTYLSRFFIEMPDENPQAAPVAETKQEPLTLFTDGSSCVYGSGAGLILTNLKGIEFTYALIFQFAASNNEVEYEALIAGLRLAAQVGVKNVHVSVDSKLVANQVLGTYVSKEDNMVKYLDKVKSNFDSRYGLLHEIDRSKSSGDNHRRDNPFKDWCDKLNITQRFASVKHPQSNGLVERANRSLEEGIKACLGEGNKNWVEELPYILWAYRTMIKSSHGDTPFSLTYGTEAVIPQEIGMPMYCTTAVDVVSNDKELWLNLDLLEERRERAAICEAKAKSKMMKYYNARVHGVTFRPGYFVYCSNDASHAIAGGKLGPKWERPYEVIEALGDGAYKLRSMDGTILPRT